MHSDRVTFDIADYPYDRIGCDRIFCEIGRNCVGKRFYCPNSPHAGRVRLGVAESRHLSRVCRLGAGDHVEVFDGHGRAMLCEVAGVSEDSVELLVLEDLPPNNPALNVTLASAVPKARRFDWLVEKATELGVERLIPLVTARSVVVPRAATLTKLKRAIIEASKQCRRDRIMVLDQPTRWDQLVRSAAVSQRLLADPEGSPPPGWPVMSAAQAVILAVGPEGGFTSEERDLARQTGWRAIRLSVNTLRIETAGLAGCAALLSRAKESNE
jgi:16S rRNA (uracil1498-N3)-methyltransferase